MQTDLFPEPEDRRCGVCVHWNRGPAPTVGACTPVGHRNRDDDGCAAWFGLEQLHRALYDRKLA